MTEPTPAWPEIQAILDRAHVGSTAEYQGQGKFWLLPLPQFLTVVIYGVRMIAAAEDNGAPPPLTSASSPTKGSCCGTTPTAPAPAAAPGRGARSGLILALRGRAPFDGSVFPAMPWGGGTPVPEADIQTIEAWIDAGCPSSGHARAARPATPSDGSRLHRSSMRPTNDVRNDQGGLKLRKNIDALSPEELQRYRAAIKQMKSLDAFPRDSRSFAAWARLHADNCQHGWEEFLTWHRMYLYYFELTLQDIDPGVTIPYWDWTTLYAVNRQVSAIDTGEVPLAFQCFVDASVIAAVQPSFPAAAAQLQTILGHTYSSAPRLFTAAGIAYTTDPARETILSALEDANPLWHRYRWPGGGSSGGQPLLFEEYPSPEDIDRVLQVEDFFAFGSGPADNTYFGALENIHNLLHNFSGGQNPNTVPGEPTTGDMVSPGVTAFDPIFWSHHSNVDRLWAEWQRLHPGRTPDNPQDILAPWTATVAQTYNTSALGYEYGLDSHVIVTDNTAAVPAVRSAPLGAKPAVLAQHRRAEVRLHKVQHMMQGGSLRVFLNEAADAMTPTRGNPRFVGTIHLFAGDCIGGEGHCAVPSNVRRPFDHRIRHRKTPNNMRIDVTAAVQALLAAGESDIHVHVVALDVGGNPSPDVLRLDAVSLVFFD